MKKLLVGLFLLAMSSIGCVGCTASQLRDANTANNVARGACTTVSIVLKNPELGTICTDSNELIDAFLKLLRTVGGTQGAQGQEMSKEILNYQIMKTIIEMRKQ